MPIGIPIFFVYHAMRKISISVDFPCVFKCKWKLTSLKENCNEVLVCLCMCMFWNT